MPKRYSGTRLREARREAELTAEQLALIAQRSYHSIVAYETGRAHPPVNVLARMALALGRTVDDLLVDVDTDRRAAA